jgi:hypothetical protein
MKPLLITSLLVLAAPQADAGDWSIGLDFGFRKRGTAVRVGVKYDDRDHGRRARRVPVRRRPVHRPVVHHCERVWVPGHYDTVARRVYVPGYTKTVWHPARYEFRYRHGCRVRVLISEGHYDTVRVPGRYETQHVRVWHPGRFEHRCDTPGHSHRHLHR